MNNTHRSTTTIQTQLGNRQSINPPTRPHESRIRHHPFAFLLNHEQFAFLHHLSRPPPDDWCDSLAHHMVILLYFRVRPQIPARKKVAVAITVIPVSFAHFHFHIAKIGIWEGCSTFLPPSPVFLVFSSHRGPTDQDRAPYRLHIPPCPAIYYCSPARAARSHFNRPHQLLTIRFTTSIPRETLTPSSQVLDELSTLTCYQLIRYCMQRGCQRVTISLYCNTHWIIRVSACFRHSLTKPSHENLGGQNHDDQTAHSSASEAPSSP